jgi:hypothetical protein
MEGEREVAAHPHRLEPQARMLAAEVHLDAVGQPHELGRSACTVEADSAVAPLPRVRVLVEADRHAHQHHRPADLAAPADPHVIEPEVHAIHPERARVLANGVRSDRTTARGDDPAAPTADPMLGAGATTSRHLWRRLWLAAAGLKKKKKKKKKKKRRTPQLIELPQVCGAGGLSQRDADDWRRAEPRSGASSVQARSAGTMPTVRT